MELNIKVYDKTVRTGVRERIRVTIGRRQLKRVLVRVALSGVRTTSNSVSNFIGYLCLHCFVFVFISPRSVCGRFSFSLVLLVSVRVARPYGCKVRLFLFYIFYFKTNVKFHLFRHSCRCLGQTTE